MAESIFRVKDFTIDLKLSPEEALSLCVVLENVGGSPYNSPRKYIDDIHTSIFDKIKNFISTECFKLSENIIANKNPPIYFKDNTLEEFHSALRNNNE